MKLLDKNIPEFIMRIKQSSIHTKYYNNHTSIATGRRIAIMTFIFNAPKYDTIIYIGGMYKREKPLTKRTIYINPSISANDIQNNNVLGN